MAQCPPDREAGCRSMSDQADKEWAAALESVIADIYSIVQPLALSLTHSSTSPILAIYALLDSQDFSPNLAARDARVAEETRNKCLNEWHQLGYVRHPAPRIDPTWRRQNTREPQP